MRRMVAASIFFILCHASAAAHEDFILPNYFQWKCDTPTLAPHEIFSLQHCENLTASIFRSGRGQKIFLITWDMDGSKSFDDPERLKNMHSALYKDGEWIFGAHGRNVDLFFHGSGIVFSVLDAHGKIKASILIERGEDTEELKNITKQIRPLGYTPSGLYYLTRMSFLLF